MFPNQMMKSKDFLESPPKLKIGEEGESARQLFIDDYS